MKALTELGCKISEKKGYLHVKGRHIAAANLTLSFPSVGATENLMLASSMAQGTTVIRNAACEPEIEDLAAFVNAMGGDVSGAGTPVIIINGVPSMHGACHRTVGDRIEAGTFLAAGALAGGPVRVCGVNPDHLALALRKLADMGCTVETGADWVRVSREAPLKPVDIQTLPHPGFPTYLPAQFMVLDAAAQGTSIITETVFENRFMFASELCRMGADVRIDGHHALISGVDGFSGAPVSSTDLRGGAALVIAALVQFIDIAMKRFLPALHAALGIFLPLITTNCAVLGVAVLNAKENRGFPESVLFALFAALGFALALLIFAGLREKLARANPPRAFQGVPVALVTAGLLALAFMGFNGLVK